MAGTSAVDDIRKVLRKEIVERYAPGDALPNERELAERFGVARNTIRETMIHLEAFGLIEKTKRGAKVQKPDFNAVFEVFAQHFDNSPQAMGDVLNFRRIVETGAAAFAVSGVDDEILKRMENANRSLASALTVSEAAGHDYEFHLCLVAASRNAVLLSLYQVMAVTIRYYLEIGKTRRLDTEAACAQHERIIEALRARDDAQLASALNAHFDHSGSVLAAQAGDRTGAAS